MDRASVSGAFRRATDALARPVDASSLGALRVAFGALMLIAVARTWAMGWIDELYVRPAFHFAFPGFEWIRPLPGALMYVPFAVLAITALLVALGVAYRAAIVAFTIVFAYVELCDATYYLNHYYAIVLVGALLAVMPADRALALRGDRARRTVPAITVVALRAQLAVIYVFAGIAKLSEDWLVRAEPLRTWLLARTDVPIVGPLLAWPETAYAMSWGGAIFDLTIPIWLAWRRTRPLAFAAVVAFHLATAALFRIGLFPLVMIALTPIFFEPDWPRRLARRPPIELPAARPLPAIAYAALAIWLAIQVALPLRHARAPEGTETRFAWRVMVAERAGWAELRAVDEAGHRWEIDPSRELTPLQARMMAVEPDLLAQYARHVREDFARRGHEVEIQAEVWVSANGRETRRVVNPRVDLASDPQP